MGQAEMQARAGLPRLLAIIGIVAVLALGAGAYLLRWQGLTPDAAPPISAAAPSSASSPAVASQAAAPPVVPGPAAVSEPAPAAAKPTVSALLAPTPLSPVSPAPVATAPTPAASVAAPSAVPVPPVAAEAVAPSFDVVRVGPQGGAVVAGRAAPGSEVVLLEGSREIGRTRADRQGSFVVIPAAPLEPGGRSLTLASRNGAAPEVRGDGAVMVVVPPSAAAAPAAAQAPVAVLVPNAGAPVVLQQERAGRPVGLDTVDYDEKGGIRFTGHAASGSTLRLYVDNQPVGDAAADAAGRWVLSPPDAVQPGVHTLRVDRLDAAGRVLARVELPFQRASLTAPELTGELAGGRIVVQPGQNLWRMARSAYGSGVRYTVIYLANREQIRDPARIYPGQAFSVPQAAR